MSVVKSLYIPAVSVEYNRVDIATRFDEYGQIHRIDYSEDYQTEFGDTVGDVFIHFYTYNPDAEDGYLEHQHKLNQPMYTYLGYDTILVKPYISRYQDCTNHKNKTILELKRDIEKMQYEKKYDLWKHNRDWKQAINKSWNYVTGLWNDIDYGVRRYDSTMKTPNDFYVEYPHDSNFNWN